MRRTGTTSTWPGIGGFIFGLVLLSCVFVDVSSAQEAGRPARSLTSEDLLNRPVLYIPKLTADAGTPSSGMGSSGSTSYRDPSGGFTLIFPNGNWQANPRGGSAGRIYNQRSFRRIEDEGFASATANVYVLKSSSLPLTDPSRLSVEAQRELATMLAARFLSSNSSIASVEPTATGLYIIADQTVARRVVVRASISVFERQGRLYVVVCSASPETFETHLHEFAVITDSLASSVIRS